MVFYLLSNKKIKSVSSKTQFPSVGLKYDGLLKFIEICGGRKSLFGLTIYDVIKKIIYITRRCKSSFSEMLLLKDYNNSTYGSANIYVTHSWKKNFLKFFDAILDFLDSRRRGTSNHHGPDPVLWIDIFSKNYHLEYPPPNVHDENWSDILTNGMKRIGNCVLIIESWENILPLKKMWNLFELFVAIRTKCKIEIFMPSEGRRSFEDIIGSDVSIITSVFHTINIRFSQAKNPIYEERILEHIQATVGFNHCNKILQDGLILWLERYITDSIRGKEENSNMRTSISLVSLSSHRNRPAPLFIPGSPQWQRRLSGGLQAVSPSYVPFNPGQPTAAASAIENAEHDSKTIDKKTKDTQQLVCLLSLEAALGSLLASKGDYIGAEHLFRHSYEQMVATVGSTDRRAITMYVYLNILNYVYIQHHRMISVCIRRMGNLAGALQCLGRSVEAAELYENCLSIQIEVLGRRDLLTLSTINCLTSVYQSLGEGGRAIAMYKDLQANQLAVLGGRHSFYLRTCNNLAVILQQQGKLDEAEKLLEECLLAQRRSLGDRHCDTLTTMANLAAVQQLQERYELASNNYSSCLSLQRYILGDKHPDTLGTMCNLASTLECRGIYGQAEQLYLECLGGQRQILGDWHSDTLTTMSNLALLYQRQQQHSKAERLLLKCYCVRRQLYGNNHMETMAAKAVLDTVRGYMGGSLSDRISELPSIDMGERSEDPSTTSSLRISIASGLGNSTPRHGKPSPRVGGQSVSSRQSESRRLTWILEDGGRVGRTSHGDDESQRRLSQERAEGGNPLASIVAVGEDGYQTDKQEERANQDHYSANSDETLLGDAPALSTLHPVRGDTSSSVATSSRSIRISSGANMSPTSIFLRPDRSAAVSSASRRTVTVSTEITSSSRDIAAGGVLSQLQPPTTFMSMLTGIAERTLSSDRVRSRDDDNSKLSRGSSARGSTVVSEGTSGKFSSRRKVGKLELQHSHSKEVQQQLWQQHIEEDLLSS